MLSATDFTNVRSIGRFLSEAGYAPRRLADELEVTEGPFANGENLEPLLFKTQGEGQLAVLARLFFVGCPVEAGVVAAVIPADVIGWALDCGLLFRNEGSLEAGALLIPFQDHLIACDNARRSGYTADVVVGPSGTSTQFLIRLAIGGDDETTLDVGSGSGVLAMMAAGYSRQVTGTEINARALPFAAFSAALNGIGKAEFLCGDAFAPVAGRRFTRILANPPFFLSPAKKFTYSDSPLELDGFVRRLAVEAPEYLEEGAFFQMICQWVEVEGQAWEQRLRDWTAASGCDVLVVLAPRLTPVSYAEARAREARSVAKGAPEFSFADRVNYLRERGATGVLSGVISMREAGGGRNWFTIVAVDPAGPNVGASVRERFETLTFMATRTEAEVLGSRLRFAADVQLETVREMGSGAESIELVKSEGLVDRVRLDPVVAGCLGLFDGVRTVRDVVAGVSERLQIDGELAARRTLPLVGRLLQGSFLVPAG